MKIISLLLLMLSFNSFSQEQKLNIIAPNLIDGALHNYWWMEHDKKVEAFKTTNLHKGMLKRGLNLLERPADEKLWSKFENGQVYYFFFSNIENPIKEKFLIQRIKKIVRLYKKGKMYSEKITYLVEAFKTWTGYEQVEGTIKRADGHDGIFSNIGKNRKKVVFKEFETGVGTIDKIAEDNTIWPFNPKSLYFGTKYDDQGKKLYNSVKFTDSQKWTLNVEVDKNGYLIESPELGLLKKE